MLFLNSENLKRSNEASLRSNSDSDNYLRKRIFSHNYSQYNMSLPSLTQILFGSLLDSPAIVELTARLLEKAVPIIKSHFTFSADEITRAYQESCRYSFVAISIGLDAPDSLIKKVRHPKITREFAKQIEENYYKPFCEQTGVQSFSFVKPLKKWAKNTEKLFEIKEITEDDLSALIGHRETLAISDLILAQMEQIEPVDDTLAAFLRFNGLLGDSVLFFFREQFRKDARVQATQTALQQERLCIDVRNIQTTLDDLKSTQEKHPFLSEQIAQQIQHLEQWQVQHEQLLVFQNRFAHQLDDVLDWAKDVYTSLDEIGEDVAETKETVLKTHSLAEEMNQKLDDILAAQLQNDSPQINPRDGTVQADGKLDKQAWQQACKENTLASYQAYLNNEGTPKRYAKTAQYRIQVLLNEIDDQAWNKARQENTVEAYRAYLNGNTLKKHADTGKQQILVLETKADRKVWQQACQKNTVKAYQAYLNGNTLKTYAGEAQKQLEEAEKRFEDKEIWQWTRQQNTKAAYQAYLYGDTLKIYADYARNIQSYRYIDNGDGTVTDTRTGLVWLKNANCFGKQDWGTAMQSTAKLAHKQYGLSDGSKSGNWRLPTKDELRAMVDKKYKNPALSNTAGTNHWKKGDTFSGVQTDFYWSSTIYVNNFSEVWGVLLNNGTICTNSKTATYYVWPVRGRK